MSVPSETSCSLILFSILCHPSIINAIPMGRISFFAAPDLPEHLFGPMI
jgi:hypothetical protein